jgi:hypothetical protein
MSNPMVSATNPQLTANQARSSRHPVEMTDDELLRDYVQSRQAIIARVATEQNTNAWAKAGVMIRESLAANATDASTGRLGGYLSGYRCWRGCYSESESSWQCPPRMPEGIATKNV